MPSLLSAWLGPLGCGGALVCGGPKPGSAALEAASFGCLLLLARAIRSSLSRRLSSLLTGVGEDLG